MTTGSDDVDQRQVDPTGYLVGTTWYRHWSGTDSVPRNDLPPAPSPKGKGPRSNWRRPPKRGRAPSENPYTMLLRSKHSCVIYRNDYYDPTYYPSHSDGWCTVLYIDPWDSNDDLDILGKLREKVMGSGFNALVSMAELNQSLVMIANAASALDGAYHHAKRGDWKSAGKSIAKYERARGRGVAVAKTIGSNWLEYQYGIKPLLNDVFSAATTVAHLMSVPLQRTYTVRRRKYGTLSTSSDNVSQFIEAQGFTQVKLKAIIREVNLLGLLGLNNPAAVAWEKLPYSFVVDWFVPIGSYLDALGLAKNLEGTFVTSKTTKWSYNGLTLKTGPATGIKSSYGGDQARERLVRVNRTVSSSLDVPMPSVKPLGKSATLTHTLNALGMLSQHAPKIRRAIKEGHSGGEYTE